MQSLMPMLMQLSCAADVAPGKQLTICYFFDPTLFFLWDITKTFTCITVLIALCLHLYFWIKERSRVAQSLRANTHR